MDYMIGIDLGGTNIAAGVVDNQHNILYKESVKTGCPRPAEDICADMAALAARVADAAGVGMAAIGGIGVGTPGTADTQRGVVIYSNNIEMHDLPMAGLISAATGKRVVIENDANAAAYGEYVAGAAAGRRSAVVITLGTGVGSGIIIDGKVYSGFNFAGGEIGHTVVHTGGRPCTCGRLGCFEAYASATGLKTTTAEEMAAHPDSLLHGMGEITGRSAFEAMRCGDECGKAVVDRYIADLACGVTNIINVFQPEILCIGGGICNEGETLLAPLRELVRREVYSRFSAHQTEIVAAALGNDAGIIGAAALGARE